VVARRDELDPIAPGEQRDPPRAIATV